MELTVFIRQIKTVYAAIARKIEILVVILNETEEQKDSSSRELAQRLSVFLIQLEQSLNLEEHSAQRTLPIEKRTLFLHSLHREINAIKALRAYITLSTKTPTPAIITKIHHLYREVEYEIRQQEALAA